MSPYSNVHDRGVHPRGTETWYGDRFVLGDEVDRYFGAMSPYSNVHDRGVHPRGTETWYGDRFVLGDEVDRYFGAMSPYSNITRVLRGTPQC